MKLYNKIKNNIEYAKWAKLRNEALENMKEHMHDDDQIDYNYWFKQYRIAVKKCNEIEI